ncbi:muellerian-inhibiting factor [Nematolebias whitei]|uniref:muellerian-inhibiting factor n=1 Tax=Nematolebias whitei TaxID=451745 RepID=UPI001897EEB1|nr:muellerian-inhibiting factor [Nematolebias whitei]
MSPEHAVPSVRHVPCFVDDLLAVLREATGDDGELTNNSLTLFGICTAPENSTSRSGLSEFVEEMRNHTEGMEVLHPSAVLMSEEGDQTTITVTFDLPQSPSLKLKPVLLLAFERPLPGGELGVALRSQSLQPTLQSVCISEGTQYILLTAKPIEGGGEQKWRISVETKSPVMEQDLKYIFNGGKPGSSIRMTPLLLFSAEKRTDMSRTNRFGSSSASSQTSFLCELRRFLDVVLPHDLSKPPQFRLDSLQSLPPLTLGLSSSETLLAGIINSTAPTIFSFHSWSSRFPVRRGRLALSSALLDELGQKLEKSEMQIMELVNEKQVALRTAEKLERLKQLSAFQKQEAAADESQYCAFLLHKALQTVTHAYNMQRRLRATRADSSSSPREYICALRSLTVSFEKLLVGPQSANINNCQGSCAFPLTNGNNHAVLLNSHTERGHVDERAPCCVPVAYDPLEVIDWNAEGSFLSIKPDMIAKECGCR